MKLKMDSFDFEKCTLTFSVPKEIMRSRSFGNVPGGVEVDLGIITKDATLGVGKAAETPDNKAKDAIAFVEKVAKISTIEYAAHQELIGIVNEAGKIAQQKPKREEATE